MEMELSNLALIESFGCNIGQRYMQHVELESLRIASLLYHWSGRYTVFHASLVYYAR
jgi:hypothetical protein